MTRVLITGTSESAKTTLDAFAASNTPTALVEAGQSIPNDEPFTHYVQMPVSVQLDHGHSAVQRFSEFIHSGLLARSELISEVLPHLAEDAVVLLVTGNSPDAEEVDLPDDPGARRSLLHVLASALRQDRPKLRVEVLDRSMGSKQIAKRALAGKPAPAQTDYAEDMEDWRILMEGIVGTEF